MSLTMLGDLTRRLDQRRGACALIAIKERSRCKTRLWEALGCAKLVVTGPPIQAARAWIAAHSGMLRQAA